MKIKTVLIALLASLLCHSVSFSQFSQGTSPLRAGIDSLKARYAPDRRLAVFEVSCAQEGGVAIVRGEVDNPKAKDDVLSLIHSKFDGQIIDSLKVLPDPRLGDLRYGIV